MSVHYKFKSALDYDTVTFDGLHISVGDLKAAISQQKRIGKTSDFDLEITNAQTKEVYVDDHTLIPKNTSLLVARVPLSQQPKKQWEGSNSSTSAVHKDVAPNKGLADLSRMEGSEQDKINAMISQSTFDYDPSNYQKIRGQNQRGIVPPNYTCYKCQKHGHWIKDCPIAASGETIDIKRSTGIPRSFMVPVEGPKAPGAMMTPSGTFAVPAVDRDAYLASESAGGGDSATAGAGSGRAAEAAPAVPDELVCSLCRDLLTDAVMIPCCGNSFCDECIRGALLESEDHECPDCREKEISPTTLIPNRFLRNSVSSFRNQTGYSRRTPHRPAAIPVQVPQPDPAARGHGVPQNGPGSHPGQNPVGPPHGLKHPGMDGPSNVPIRMPPRSDEQRASTPTVDERREPISQPVYNRGPPPGFIPGGPMPPRPYNNAPPFGRPPPGAGAPPFAERFPREPYQPPPPGIKDSPNGRSDDPLEAFNRMIREKEMRAKRREEERRRAHSGSRSPRSRSPRSPSRSARSPPRSPRSARSLPRSPRSARSPPRSPRPLRSPRLVRSPRSPVSPRLRPRSRGSSRIRYSRSRSPSRGRMRRSPPWSPRRRRTRERTLSLTRSPSPRRRPRSPLRYRSPLRSPPPLRGGGGGAGGGRPSPPPPRSPHRPPKRGSPHPLSPPRYAGVYDELLSPPRRNVEPPYGARYGPRNNAAAPNYPPMGQKVIPPLMNNLVSSDQTPGYRGRYEGPPPFEDIPPGVEPPVPGFEPPPFDKPPFGPPGTMDRDRLPPPNYRDSYGARQPYGDGPGGFREMPVPSIQNEIPVQLGEPPRFRENYRPGPPSYRDGPLPQFRESQPFRDPGPQGPYRDSNYRGGPPAFREGQYRNVPFREPGFREVPPHNSFRDGPPFRQPSTDPRDPREPVPPNYDPNFRDNFRDDGVPREHGRPGYRPGIRSRGGPRRNTNMENERHREREAHEREKYNEARETERAERSRDPDKRGRDGRTREIDRNREIEKERDHERTTPDKKSRGSPKRSKEGRDRKRSESRGRSRERDRDGRKDKRDERNRDKSSAERSKEHKEKEKKLKERKKKKREKEKDIEKKKKRDKKEKKDKDVVKKEDDEDDKNEDIKVSEIDQNQVEPVQPVLEQKMSPVTEEIKVIKEESLKSEAENKPLDGLYGDETAEAVDKEILQNYVKSEENHPAENKNSDTSKEEPFDGIELQANVDELDLKPEPESINKEMLAPLPELSKWEVDDDNADKTKEPGEISSPEAEEDSGKVTSDVIKRAENAIFAKAINSLRPIEIKKISNERLKLYTDDGAKTSMNNIQITVPVTDSDLRSIEINEKKRRFSKTPPPRLSVKERLGGKVEDHKRGREPRVVQSTVERVKSRSKTPKKDQPYRRVTVEKERGRKPDPNGRPEPTKIERRLASEGVKLHGKHRARSPRDKKDTDKLQKDDKRVNENSRDRSNDKNTSLVGKSITDRERKKSTLDEAHFEPDYDETVESENEMKEESVKKRELSASPVGNETKKAKIENETIKLDLANVKKKPDTESESTSDSDNSSSSSSDDARKRKKKKKRSKKKKKRAISESESDSDSSSDDHKKKKKKRKHKKKSSKKKSKKSKHK